MIDLRSDTVTLPTPRMREAMAHAEVGDDVYGEDPTINRLETMAAGRMGKAAGMYVPSGTMGNLTALLTHCGRGHEVILGDQSHTYLLEAGSYAALGGIHPRAVPNQPDGTINLDHIEAAIRAEDPHFPRTRLICLENTHNVCGGALLHPEYMAAVRGIAERHGLAMHLDGARVFNAAVALGVPATELTKDVDSVTFCLSKGLSAPVGSVLCGSEDFIYEARRARKALGGSMRQAGIIAAAGIVALEEMVDRLAEDHATAKRLAEGLASMPGIGLDPDTVETDIVFFELARDDMTPDELSEALREQGVLVSPKSGRRLRAVTHYGIDAEDIDTALSALRQALA
ncbi:MAG: L-allo-threonine aldolase [Anaerolineales bacterium]|nr:L-allo-threonine aldolase [Anaerolineales bacterium]